MEVQDRYPDTLLATDGPAVDDLIAIRLEVVVTKSAWVWDVEKIVSRMEGMETEVVKVLPEVNGMKGLETEVVKARRMEGMEKVVVMMLPEGQRQMNTTV